MYLSSWKVVQPSCVPPSVDIVAVNWPPETNCRSAYLRIRVIEYLHELLSPGGSTQPRWFVRPFDLPNPDVAVLRIVAGTHTSCLYPFELSRLSDSAFRVSSQSDRMGYRLTDHQLELEQREEMLSEGTVPGTIQLPPDGNPILLMSDCAPTGGYPRIGHVISADLGSAAQLRPGQVGSVRHGNAGTGSGRIPSTASRFGEGIGDGRTHDSAAESSACTRLTSTAIWARLRVLRVKLSTHN